MTPTGDGTVRERAAWDLVRYANVWEDAAQRNHCRFVSGSTFDGTGSGSALAATGRGVYDCPLVGTVRVSVSFQVSATQG